MHPNAMWDRHYACEWMGVPPDIAAQQRLYAAMNNLPPWDSGPTYQTRWGPRRYAKV